MATFVNVVDFWKVENMKVICADGKQAVLKLSLLPKIGFFRKATQEMNQGDPAIVKLDQFKVEPLIRIIEWLKHYENHQASASNQYKYSEWDHEFFEALNGDQIIDMAYVAHHLEVEGFEDYIMMYVKQKFMALPAIEQSRFMLQHESGEEDVLLQIARLLFKKN